MVTKQELIETLHQALIQAQLMDDDATILCNVDEGGYTEGMRPLSFFDLWLKEEEGDICMVVELGFED